MTRRFLAGDGPHGSSPSCRLEQDGRASHDAQRAETGAREDESIRGAGNASRVRAAAAAIVLVVYSGSVAVHLLPPSPARERLLPYTDRIVRPFLAQQWTLFAPDPPRASFDVWLQVRSWRGGEPVDSEPLNVSAPIRSISTSRPWAPSRVLRVPQNLAIEIERRQLEDLASVREAGLEPSARLPPEWEADIARRRAPTLRLLTRFLSGVAAGRGIGAEAPDSVRGFIVSRPTHEFGRRDRPSSPPDLPVTYAGTFPSDLVHVASGRPVPRAVLVFDSGWMPLVAGVAPIHVVAR